MQARILGTTMPVLEVDLQPNESVFSESGELSWMTGSTQMGGGGGLFGVLKRVAGGGSIFMTEYRETFSNQFVAAGRRLVDDIIEPAETRRRPTSTARSDPPWAKEIARSWPGTRPAAARSLFPACLSCGSFSSRRFFLSKDLATRFFQNRAEPPLNFQLGVGHPPDNGPRQNVKTGPNSARWSCQMREGVPAIVQNLPSSGMAREL